MKDSAGNQFSITGRDGSQWGDQSFRGWKLLGAESVNGLNTAAWHRQSDGYLWLSQHDENWQKVGSTGAAKGSDAFFRAETNFRQDFNADGVTGLPLATSESAGSIDLLKDGKGFGYAKDSAGNQFSITHSNGVQWGDNTWNGWSLAGAETIDGINTTAWKLDDGRLWFLQHNGDWAYAADGGGAAAGSAAYFQAESNFGQDFDADKSIGTLNLEQKPFL